MKRRGSYIIVKIRYLTIINGLPYFQRKYPTTLIGHPSLKSSHYKCRLHSSLEDEIALAHEVTEANNTFNEYTSLLKVANSETLSDIELERKALAYMKANGLQAGMGSKVSPFEKDEFEFSLLGSGLFDATQAHGAEEHEVGSPLPKSALVRAQEKVWHMLMEPPSTTTSVCMLSEAWKHYVSTYSVDPKERNGIRLQGTWNKFIEMNGGDDRLSQETVDRYLRKFVRERAKDGLKASSINRQLTTIITALKSFCDEKELSINVNRPPLPKTVDATESRAIPLSHVEQVELIELLKKESEWKELYVLLSLHSGCHPSEASKLTRASFDFSGEPPTVVFSPDGEGKTAERERVIPLVYRADRIQELVEKGALETLTSKSTDNISQQLKKMLAKVQPEATAYSLRHTLRHNADHAAVDGLIQSRLGGWGAKTAGVSAHMFKYGKRGADFSERIAPLTVALTKCLSHLPK